MIERIKFTVKTSSKNISMNMTGADSIKNLKKNLEGHLRVPAAKQILKMGQQELHDEHSLHHYKIKNGSNVQLTIKVIFPFFIFISILLFFLSSQKFKLFCLPLCLLACLPACPPACPPACFLSFFLFWLCRNDDNASA